VALDEVFVKINDITHYLWRAVDQHANVLGVLAHSRRNAVAAKRSFSKLRKGLRYVPHVLVTDKLGSYQVAHRRLMSSVEHPRSRYLNNHAENSHQPTRQRERAMKRFKSLRPCATVFVWLQRHLSTLSSASASAQRDPMANRDRRPLRTLVSGHCARRCRLNANDPKLFHRYSSKTDRTTTHFNQRDSARGIATAPTIG
jgi:transposase-like protein